jgi:hypothetical protein
VQLGNYRVLHERLFFDETAKSKVLVHRDDIHLLLAYPPGNGLTQLASRPRRYVTVTRATVPWNLVLQKTGYTGDVVGNYADASPLLTGEMCAAVTVLRLPAT